MRVLVVEPERRPKLKEIDGSLEAMQSIVGGLIQPVYPFEDSNVALVCNDEGKLMNLPANRGLRDKNGQIMTLYLAHSSCAAHPQTAIILPA